MNWTTRQIALRLIYAAVCEQAICGDPKLPGSMNWTILVFMELASWEGS